MFFRASLLSSTVLVGFMAPTYAQRQRVVPEQPTNPASEEKGEVNTPKRVWSSNEIRGDPDGALEAWREGANHEYGSMLYYIATGYSRLGFVPEMSMAFELWVDEDSEGVEGRVNGLQRAAWCFEMVGEFELALQVIARARAYPLGKVRKSLLLDKAELLSRMGNIDEADAIFEELTSSQSEVDLGRSLADHAIRADRWEEVLAYWQVYVDPPSSGCANGSAVDTQFEMISRSLFELGRHQDVVGKLARHLWLADAPGSSQPSGFDFWPSREMLVSLASLLRASLQEVGQLERILLSVGEGGGPVGTFAARFLEVDELRRDAEAGDLDALCRFLVEVRPGESVMDRRGLKQLALQLLREQPALATAAAWRHVGGPHDIWLTFLLADFGDVRVLQRLRDVKSWYHAGWLEGRLVQVALLGGPAAYDLLRDLKSHEGHDVREAATTILRRYPEGTNVRRKRLDYFGPF